jgi:hypothetical protein
VRVDEVLLMVGMGLVRRCGKKIAEKLGKGYSSQTRECGRGK